MNVVDAEKWGATQDAMLLDLWPLNLTGDDLAQRIGVSRDTILRHRKRLGLPSRRDNKRKKLRVPHRIWSTKDLAAFTKMWIDGVRVKIICYAFGCSATTVLEKCRFLGLKKRTRLHARVRTQLTINISAETVMRLTRLADDAKLSVKDYAKAVLCDELKRIERHGKKSKTRRRNRRASARIIPYSAVDCNAWTSTVNLGAGLAYGNSETVKTAK